MVSNNPIVGFSFVTFLRYSRLNNLRDEYHRKKTDVFVMLPLQYDCLEIVAEIFSQAR